MTGKPTETSPPMTMNQHPLNDIHRNMMRRCYDPNYPKFATHGARGIRVDERWHNFWFFSKTLELGIGERPSYRHTLDRMDVNDDYRPGNVRWATAKEQSRNKTNNVKLTARGRTQCIAAWAEELGLYASTLTRRLARGLKLEDMI